MNDNLRKTSKLIAKNALTSNFGKILAISATSYLPQFLLPMVYYYTVVFGLYLEVIYETDANIANEMSVQLLIYMGIYYLIQIGCSLLFYPITARSVSLYSDILKGKPTKYSELFEYYGDKRIVKCYKTYFYILFRTILLSLPFILLTCLLSAGLVFFFSTDSMILLIMGVLLFYAIFLVGNIIFIGCIKPIAFGEVLAFVHIDDKFFKTKHAIKALNSSLPKGLLRYIFFDMSFWGWLMLASLGASMSFGITMALFQAYMIMASIVYAQASYDEYNMKQTIRPEY